MAKLSLDSRSANMHPRENLFASAPLSSLNAAISCYADGASTLAAVVNGTYVGTLTFEGTVDGVNWDTIPVKPVKAGGLYVMTLASGVAGRWKGPIGEFQQVRARMSTYTSGAANVMLMVSNGIGTEAVVIPKADVQHAEILGTTGAAATLTIPAPGPGLFQYISRLLVQRIVSAGPLTPSPAPLTVTTTNLIGNRTIRLPASAAATGEIAQDLFEGSKPIRAVVANAAVSIVMPPATGVIWFAAADYDNLPEG